MNARSVGPAMLAALAALAGCSSTGGGPVPAAEWAPGAPADPDFTAQYPPIEAPAAAHGGGRVNALVGLYGELQTGRDEPRDGTWDRSANVAQVTFATEGACSDPDVNAAGTHLVFASTQHSPTSDIYLKPVSGRTVTQLTTDPSDDIMPVFHPSGDRLAFASNRAGNWDIYVMSTRGGQPMKVTDEPEPELHPSWSPDGKHLIYCKLGARSGRWEMWVVEIDNPGVRRFIDYGLFPQWCPDPARNKILFQRARRRGSRLFSVWTIDYVNGDGVHPTEITSAGNAAIINPAWSPDGSKIVFVTIVEPDMSGGGGEIGQSDLWVVNLDGSGRTNLTNGQYANYQPVWDAAGRVYFVSDRTGVDNIWSVSATRTLQSEPSRITTAMPEELPVGRP